MNSIKKPSPSEENISQISITTRDQDLVEIAGYHSYRTLTKDKKVPVNGNWYKVMNTNYNHPTGLDAVTLKNTATGEIIIAYTGTDSSQGTDLVTDANLLSDRMPSQLQAARDYFDFVENKIGHVSYVCGNSLGGGNANAVGVLHPDVKTVTLNPALLPDGVVDPDKKYTNITNYFSKYDGLTKIETALNLGHRIPGKQYVINNGIPELSKFATNHTGYIGNNDDNGIQYYIVGEPGKPGYGKIYIDADAHIVSSIWTGKPLYSEKTERIHIDQKQMDVLATSLKSHVIKRVDLVETYLKHSNEIVQDEGSRYYERLSRLQETFRTMFEEAAGSPLFAGITTSGYLLKSSIDGLITLLNTAESKAQALNFVLNSPPAEIVEHVFHQNISTESLFTDARNFLLMIRSDVDNLAQVLPHFVASKIPELFEGGTDHFMDAVVGELQAHYTIISNNNKLIGKHLADYERQVTYVAADFENRDTLLAEAIRNGATASLGAPTTEATQTYHLEGSPYLKMGMKLLEIQLELAFSKVTQVSHTVLLPILVGLEGFTRMLEQTLESISSVIKGGLQVALNGTVPGKLIGFFTDFDDKIRQKVYDALEPIDEMADTVEGLRRGIGNLIIFYPQLLQNFKPYLYSALFSQTKYYNVHLYNLAAMGILEEMDLLFKDIVYQLSDQEANAIDALCDVSSAVKHNMKILNEQVDRGTIT
ncbi:SA1320 family protein [Fictibacillus barbaricus]|uniref:SA1320 family protein n=1 Tax=Fictibacillus barbaricus TaxID=182136 RepID=UPI0037C0DBA5